MKQYFVTADTAQLVSFGAKIVVGLTVSKTASLISYFSTPKALIFLFFGAFDNLFALATDPRCYPSVRSHRTSDMSVKFGTWITIITAFLVASAVLVTDLLLFQLAAKETSYEFKLSKNQFLVADDKSRVGINEFIFPKVLLSNQRAVETFGNTDYLSNDGGTYMNYTTRQSAYYIIDGPDGQIGGIRGVSIGVPKCTVAHKVRPRNVEVADPPVRIRCYRDFGSRNITDIVDEKLSNLGFNGNKIVSYYQTLEGANYLFVELIQRTYEQLSTINGTSGDLTLSSKIQGLEEEGYRLESASTHGIVVNRSSNALTAMELIRRSFTLGRENNTKVAASTFLFSKTELSYRYNEKPIYTKKFILWGTYLGINFFRGNDIGNYYAYNYQTRQMLVKGANLRPELYGANSSVLNSVPLSPEFSTDLDEEKIVLATLENPQQLSEVISREMIDILPGLILIGTCVVYVLIVTIFHSLVGRHSPKGFPFEVGLEVYHKAFENLNGLTAWYLPAKFEGTKDLVMYKDVPPNLTSVEVGLGSKGKFSGNSVSQTSQVSSDNLLALNQT